jgi:nucleoside-diphosphate-sugar epimerase
MEQKNTALVLGATGGIGGEVARLLVARGWKVRALHRAPERVSVVGDGIEWRAGDAMERDDVVGAAKDVALVLPMMDNTIAAARASGARILLPGTIYNYGPDAFPHVREDSPQHPVTRKGAIRVELEARLRAAAADGVRTLIVRAGDFFGPRAGNSWLSQGLIKPGRPVTAISNPSGSGVGHQWAYLPDVAETMVRLVEKGDALPAFATYQMEGHWDPDGTRIAAAIARAAGKPDLKARAFPWWLLTLGAPFVPVFRELREMRHLWRQPVRMSNALLRSVLGAEPHTPLDAAMRATLIGLGCLEQPEKDGPERRQAASR